MRHRYDELRLSLLACWQPYNDYKGAFVGCRVSGRRFAASAETSSHPSSKNKYLDWVEHTFVHIQCVFHPVGITVLGMQYVEAKFRARGKGVFSNRSWDKRNKGGMHRRHRHSILLCPYIFDAPRIKLLRL